MSEQQPHENTPTDCGDSPSETETGRPPDEESQQRQHIRETGEPERDRLGNEDGAS